MNENNNLYCNDLGFGLRDPRLFVLYTFLRRILALCECKRMNAKKIYDDGYQKIAFAVMK